MPAEWEPHAACWLAWPTGEELWGPLLADVRRSFVNLCAAIAVPGEAAAGGAAASGEEPRILVADEAEERIAQAALAGVPARFFRMAYGDVWLRDTAPVFTVGSGQRVAPVRFRFNGWGGKYLFAGDVDLAERIAAISLPPRYAFPWILEGGSIEVDGAGTCLTTRQCLLNPNRNPTLDEAAIERGLRDALGVERIVWLDRGLVNDHTDGHIDTIARFIAPGVVVCMEATTADDPNRQVLDEIARALADATDARGQRLDVVRIPGPGRVCDDAGAVIAASYVNFYIANGTVSVPTYGVPADERAVEALAACFPGRRVAGISARALVASGGGAFHCITQQVPAGTTAPAA
jgi:agmatine deiminase